MTAKKSTAKPTAAKTAPVAREGRRDRQEIIWEVITAAGGKLSADKIEAAAQKIKSVTAGTYASTAKRNFVMKEDNVLPEISEAGFKTQLLYAKKRNLSTWVLRTFPTEAAAAAKKLGLPMPKVDPSPSSFSHRHNPVVIEQSECPMCIAERQKQTPVSSSITVA